MVITRRSIARKTLAAARIYNNVPATPSSSIAAKTQTLSASSRQSSTPMASQALTQDNPKDAPADPDGSGSLVAFEALGLATMNVVAFALLLTGSIAYAFDLSSVDDLRAYARRRFGLTGGAPADVASAEQALEEWIAETLERRRRREGASEAKKDEK